MAESDSCAVFVGPSGLGPWEEREVNAAISLQVKSRRLRVIPVTLPGARPEQLQNLPLFLQGNTWVEFPTLDDTAPEFQNAFYRLKCGILGLQPGPGHSHEIDEGVCPYRGLDVFKPEHAKFFFGRRVLVERLLDVLRIRSDANQPQSRLVAVVGASGAGKSSLVLAGLVPELEKGRLGGSERWPILVFRPGSDPLESMEVGLGSHPDFRSTYGDVENVARQLEGGRQKRLHLAVRLAMQNRPDADRAVIVVDQFEELFTHCQSDTQRMELIDNLLSAAGAVGGRALVVLTLRADFYGHCALHSAFADVLSQSHVLVGPIASNEELREIIEQPAWLVGLECEPGLVEMLIQDMRRQPNALPLLEHALRMLWERREGRRLTVSAYRAIGELEGALRQHADSLFQSLSAEEKAACRRVFERLVKPGEGVHDTRRRASLPEFSLHEQSILRGWSTNDSWPRKENPTRRMLRSRSRTKRS